MLGLPKKQDCALGRMYNLVPSPPALWIHPICLTCCPDSYKVLQWHFEWEVKPCAFATATRTLVCHPFTLQANDGICHRLPGPQLHSLLQNQGNHKSSIGQGGGRNLGSVSVPWMTYMSPIWNPTAHQISSTEPTPLPGFSHHLLTSVYSPLPLIVRLQTPTIVFHMSFSSLSSPYY